jgi:phage terminase large subunit-like protein
MAILMQTRKCNYHPYIDEYIDGCRNGTIVVGNDILLACDIVEEKLNNPDVFIDTEKIDKAIELTERYFEIKLFDWELFIFALIHCYYVSTDTVVFDEFIIMMGRGDGKNGFISPVAWYLTTHYHGIKEYNVDIIANSEDQAETSFMDIYNVLERYWGKLKKFFYKSLEKIKNLKTGSVIRYHTSNAKTKDGKRSACLIFDEIHEYMTYAMINVFTSGFGKRKHSRVFKITTNGHVRDGVLDKELAICSDILKGIIKNSKTLPLLYRVDSEEEIKNPLMWHKPCPSLKYLPVLQDTMNKEFAKMEYDEEIKSEFYTKRMNWPRSNKEVAVTDYDKNIVPTNRPLPDMTGWSCTVGIDYAQINDWASVNYHFKRGDERFDINHSWLCLQSKDLNRLKVPWQEWGGDVLQYITLVDDVSINPELIAEHITTMAQTYNIKKIALDNNRYALVASALKKIGFDAKENKNVVLVRPNDIYKVQTVIDDCFTRHLFTWGDYPPLRWAVNNTKKMSAGKKEGTETGNYYYAKIESKSRKTDPFMALVHAMTIESELEGGTCQYDDIPVIM